jgi:hypothetical protein
LARAQPSAILEIRHIETDRTQQVSMSPPKGLRAHRAQQLVSGQFLSVVAAPIPLVKITDRYCTRLIASQPHECAIG